MLSIFSQKATTKAHNNAYKSITSFLAAPQTKNKNLETWFGVNPVHHADVVKKLQRMTDVLKVEKITYKYRFSGRYCKNTFVYTYNYSRKIWLCKLYMKAKATGVDSKMGILTHELSHAIAGTDDKAYGFNQCKKLARKAPNVAIINADNFEYFVETLHL